MKNIVIKFKQGYVGMAHNLTGEIQTHKFEQEELGFAVGKHTPDTGIPNVFWAMDAVLKETHEFISKNPNERVQIAVPGTVAALANNLDMLTKMMWTRRMLYSTVTDQKSHRTILLYRKTLDDRYALSDAEFTAYRNLFNNVKRLMGYVLFVDSQFIVSRAENAKTPEQKAWFDVNQACSTLMNIGAQSVSPYASMATGTEDSAPAFDTSDDGDDLPF